MKKDQKKLLMAKISSNITTPPPAPKAAPVEKPQPAPPVAPPAAVPPAPVATTPPPATSVPAETAVQPPPQPETVQQPAPQAAATPVAPPTPVAAAPQPLQMPVMPKLTRPSQAAAFTGKQAAFWINDEDRAIFNELVMLLRSQGVKASDNLVMRAALRMVPKDYRLVEKIQELMKNDGRKLRHAENRA